MKKNPRVLDREVEERVFGNKTRQVRFLTGWEGPWGKDDHGTPCFGRALVKMDKHAGKKCTGLYEQFTGEDMKIVLDTVEHYSGGRIEAGLPVLREAIRRKVRVSIVFEPEKAANDWCATVEMKKGKRVIVERGPVSEALCRAMLRTIRR